MKKTFKDVKRVSFGTDGSIYMNTYEKENALEDVIGDIKIKEGVVIKEAVLTVDDASTLEFPKGIDGEWNSENQQLTLKKPYRG